MKLGLSIPFSICLIIYFKSELSESAGQISRGGGGRNVGSKGAVLIRKSQNYRSNRYESRRYTYTKWDFRSGIRYSSTNAVDRRDAIMAGMILLSHRQQNRIRVYRSWEITEMSVCANAESENDNRNATISPWFGCPWSRNDGFYCCGSEFEEYCCRYFDRTGHLVGLIIGMIILALFLICCCWCCKSKSSDPAGTTVANAPSEQCEPIVCKVDSDKVVTNPVYPPQAIASPPYPVNSSTLPELATAPYPIAGSPYPVKPGISDPASMPLSVATALEVFIPTENPSSYDKTGPTYSADPNSQDPPPYSSVVKM